jgi:hypothetical protein
MDSKPFDFESFRKERLLKQEKEENQFQRLTAGTNTREQNKQWLSGQINPIMESIILDYHIQKPPHMVTIVKKTHFVG